MSENTQAKHHPHVVEITVNNKTVHIEGPKATGLEIKQAAVEQGVQIELDFQLAELLANGTRQIIGNGDPVVVHKDSRFVATAPDDSSQDER